MLRPEDCFYGNDVVCIRKPRLHPSANPVNLEVGGTYTIEDYFPKGTFTGSPDIDAVSLVGMHNGDFNIHGFSTELFRTIDKDVIQFYKLLKKPIDKVLQDEKFDEELERIKEDV